MECSICAKLVSIETNYIYGKPRLCSDCINLYLPCMRFEKITHIPNGDIWHFYVSEKEIPKEHYLAIEQYFKAYYLLANHYNLTVLVFDNFPSEDYLKLFNQIDNSDLIVITYSTR